jgi:adenylate cyclase
LSLFRELKRRNVFRVSIAYIVMAWLVMQITDVILNNIVAPAWVFHVLLLFVAVGFPFAVFFAWAFELTPDGIKREHEVDRSLSITPYTGKKLDRIIIVVLVLALGYFAFDKFILSTSRDAALAEASARAAAGQEATSGFDRSIAVLPFLNMSDDAGNEYFSDGLSEELLNLLAKIPELKVASRSSSFQFKGEKIDVKEAAQKLNVAHVLEGSVRKSGKQIRITAQLIKADDGYHMWSQTYDRSLDNIFAIQDEISASVVAALKVELLGEVPKAEVVNAEAYTLFLKARYLYSKWGKENFESAIEAFRQALIIEPEYAEAWASLSVAYLTQATSGYRPRDEGLALARDAVERALSYNPGLAAAWARLSLIQSRFEWDWAGAEVSVQKALDLEPNDYRVLSAAGSLSGTLDRLDDALAYYRRILDKEPLELISLYNVAEVLLRQGRLVESEAAFRRLLELNPEDWGTHTQLAIILLMQGEPQQAWRELDLEVDPLQQEFGRILALSSLERETEAAERLHAYIEENQSWAAFPIAGIYAWQGDVDTAFSWLETAIEQRDSSMTDILTQPLLTSLHDDPRWMGLLEQMGLPY